MHQGNLALSIGFPSCFCSVPLVISNIKTKHILALSELKQVVRMFFLLYEDSFGISIYGIYLYIKDTNNIQIYHIQ
uniref:Uncharacterized protein n=1 Tax=Pararge aegeria TaxID=116150 RepID=S4PT18_9NEOP